MHFFHCPSSQGQYIRWHDHIRTLSSTRSVTPSDLMRTLTTSKLSANHLCERTSHPRLIPHQPGEEAMEVEPGPDARLAEDSDDIAYIEEMQRSYWSRMTIRDLHQRNLADKVAGQCRGDIGIYTDGSRGASLRM